MPTLHETERAFAVALRSGDAGEFAGLMAPAGIPAAEAIGIYRNTFLSGAARALALSHPAVERLTGAEFFHQAAEDFIAKSPPSSGCLDDYGAGFAEFLADYPAVAELPYIADVARLEWAVSSALHAADAPVLAAAALSAGGIDAARLILRPHPSLSLVKTAFPADDIWRAVLARDDAALSSLELTGGPFHLVIWRAVDGVEVRRLGEAGFLFLSSLCSGRSFATSFNIAPAADVPQLFAECLAAGCFTTIGEMES